jgi:AraC family transcriptional activator of pobA
MPRVESIEDFYKETIGWLPETLRNDLGHFNIFKSDPYVGNSPKPVPYRRRDYYKIALFFGKSELSFADKVVRVEKQALLFANPLIPYSNPDLSGIARGYFCVFNQQFFHQFGKLDEYPV